METGVMETVVAWLTTLPAIEGNGCDTTEGVASVTCTADVSSYIIERMNVLYSVWLERETDKLL